MRSKIFLPTFFFIIALTSISSSQNLSELRQMLVTDSWIDLGDVFATKCFGLYVDGEKFLSGNLSIDDYGFNNWGIYTKNQQQTSYTVWIREFIFPDTTLTPQSQINTAQVLQLWNYDKNKPIYYFLLKANFNEYD